MVRPGDGRRAAGRAVPPSESAFTLDVGSAMFKSAVSKSRGTDGEASADDTAGPAVDVANLGDLVGFDLTSPAPDDAASKRSGRPGTSDEDAVDVANAVPSYGTGNFRPPVWSLSSMRFRHAIRDGGERAERLFDEMLRGAEKKIADAERRAAEAESIVNEHTRTNASLNGDLRSPATSQGPPSEGGPTPVRIERKPVNQILDEDERRLERESGGSSPRVRLPPLESPPVLATRSGGSFQGDRDGSPTPLRPLSAREQTKKPKNVIIDQSRQSSGASTPTRDESPRHESPAAETKDGNIGGAFGFRRPTWSLTSMAARHRRVNGSPPRKPSLGEDGLTGATSSMDADPAELARRLAASLSRIDEAVGDHRGDARTALKLVRDALSDAKGHVDAAKRL